jgi:peptidoglycan/xylan/chitin deacetylase (PgdA/CDA1 family)
MADSPAIPLAIFGTSAGVLSAVGLWAYSVFVPRCQFWAPVIRSLPQREAVTLTFENGPDEQVTPRLLDLLATENLKATFFVIGARAKQHPAEIRQIHAAGHTLGNHSLDHAPGGWKRDLKYWQAQLRETQSIVADITGTPPLLFRPPWGHKTRPIAAAAAGLHLPIVTWSVAAPRTADAAAFAKYMVKRTTGHDILLLHDGPEPGRDSPGSNREAMLSALPALFGALRDKRLQVVPLVDALLAASDERAAQKLARSRA